MKNRVVMRMHTRIKDIIVKEMTMPYAVGRLDSARSLSISSGERFITASRLQSLAREQWVD